MLACLGRSRRGESNKSLQRCVAWPGDTRSRKKRKPYTRYQTMVLENEFVGNAYITRQKRWEISCKLHLTERQCCHTRVGDRKSHGLRLHSYEGQSLVRQIVLTNSIPREVDTIYERPAAGCRGEAYNSSDTLINEIYESDWPCIPAVESSSYGAQRSPGGHKEFAYIRCYVLTRYLVPSAVRTSTSLGVGALQQHLSETKRYIWRDIERFFSWEQWQDNR
ncbi:Homeobox D12 [Cichlidogyrus casuarinus]|uniref:Homeobox D12 n=1 Tax=Cichlidogyrus casuarinus TaxID=1844966 RepID=A0ABD2Q3B2_9PLAT